jgi:hypothetical protein
MKRLLASIALLCASLTAFPQTGAIQGHSFLGGTQVSTQGLASRNYFDGIIPSATITVYYTGTQILASPIYSDALNTPLANPFTSNAIGTVAHPSVNPGGWIFFAPCGIGYDVVMSGGIAPNTYSQPVTVKDVFPACAGGAGSPFFIQVNGVNLLAPGSANFVNTDSVTFSNPSGTTIQATASGGGSGLTLQHNAVNLTDQALLNFVDDNTIAPDPGYTLAKFLPNSTGALAAEYLPGGNQLQTLVNAPVSGQYIILYPTAVSCVPAGCNTSSGGAWVTANLNSALLGIFPPGIGSNAASATWSGFTLPGSISPSSVTAVYPFSTNSSSFYNGFIGLGCTGGGGNLIPASGISWPMQQFTGTTGITGSGIATTSCTASLSADPAAVHLTETMNVSSIGLIVYYTGTPIALSGALQIAPPLYENTATNTLGIDPNAPFPGLDILPTTVAALPAQGPPLNAGTYLINNGANSTDCTTGGGSTQVWCTWNGTGFTGSPFSGVGSAVTSINSTSGAFTFSFSAGAGSCSGTTCTFTGSGSGGGSVTNFLTGTWPSYLTPSVATSTTTPTLSVSASAIPNSALANAATTVNGQTCTLGSTCTITTSTSPIVASAEVVAFSATPTFSIVTNVSRIVLTGNITSFTLAAGADGQDKKLCFEQGSGPFTVSPPANVHGFFTVGATNATWSCQSFNSLFLLLISGAAYGQATAGLPPPTVIHSPINCSSGCAITTSSGGTNAATTAATATTSTTATNAITATNLQAGALGGVPYQTSANSTLFVASPTTSGHTFSLVWQPLGSQIAPVTLDTTPPTAGDIVISGGPSSPPTGVAPVNGDCVIGSAGAWIAGSCTGTTGFPITIGSTSISGGSTTTSVAGLTVNGVLLNSTGSANNFLDAAGSYTAPFSLTTTGSGASTFSSGTLNVPNYTVTWPTSQDLVISNGTNTPSGLVPINGDVVIGSAGVWTAGAPFTLTTTGSGAATYSGGVLNIPIAGGSSGFPITLGSTTISAGSTTTAISGLTTINGVHLTSTGSTTLFLNQAGGYTAPTGGGGGVPANSAYIGGNSSGVAIAVPTSDRITNAVLDYEADNTGAAEASTQIANCINNLPANGGTCYLPKGTYLDNLGILISATSNTKKGIKLIGEGMSATRIMSNCSGNGHILWFDNTSTTAGNQYGPDIEDMSFYDTSGTAACAGFLRITQFNNDEGHRLAFWGAAVAKQYTTGTVSVTNGSTAVTGSGTTWTSAMVPGFLWINGTFQEVIAFNSSTSLTLTAPWQQTTVSGSAYSLDTNGNALWLEGTTATGFAQYGTFTDIYSFGNRVCVYGEGGPTSSQGISRFKFIGGFCNGQNTTDSMGAFFGQYGDTEEWNIPVNNTAFYVDLENTHLNRIEGEYENINGSPAPVTTCNGGTASQNCSIGVNVVGSSQTLSFDNLITNTSMNKTGYGVVWTSNVYDLRVPSDNRFYTGSLGAGNPFSLGIFNPPTSGIGSTSAKIGIPSKQITIAPATYAANTCTAAVPVTFPGFTNGASATWTPTADYSGDVGWGASGGLLYIQNVPSANTLNYRVCNLTASSITTTVSTVWNVSAQ